MREAQVITLHEVLDQTLPVRCPDFLGAVERMLLLHMIVLNVGFELPQSRLERLRVRFQIDKNEPLPSLDREAGKPTASFVESIHQRRTKQFAVDSVSPRVVSAGESASIS